MKKIIAILILLMACAPKITHIPRSSSFWGIDFSKYSNQNFLFTPYQYLGDYKSIGLITIKVWPEANLNEIIVEDSRGNKEKKEIWSTENLELDNVIEEYYKKAIMMGANAVVDLKIISTTKIVKADKQVQLDGLEISGFAIKRLGSFK